MRIFYAALCGLLFFCLPATAWGQKTDFTIHLKSGKFIPAENLKVLTKDSAVFRNSLFRSKHYVVVQLEQLPNDNLKSRLRSAGVEILEFLSGNAYIAILQQNINLPSLKSLPVRGIFQLSDHQKSSPEINSRQYPAHAIREADAVDVNVVSFQLFSTPDLMPELSRLGISVLEEQPMFRTVVLRVPQKSMAELVKLPWVQWVEPIDPPNKAENLLGRTLHNVNVLNDGFRNLKGTGVKVGIWDGGEVDRHLDFSAPGRLILLEKGSTTSHGTHVAGTLGGAGVINPKARGMAPNAIIYSSDFSIGTSTTELFNAISQHGLNISSHSYGGGVAVCAITGSQLAYSATARNADITLNTFPNHLHVQSSGNSQSSCTGGFYTITGSTKPAKNNIVVANIESNDAISISSSFGPVHDGRIKPEISGFGTNVLSTYTPNNTYSTISGTSMSTPGISGTLALLVERYRQLNSNADPLSSLMKGVVCNTATDLGNVGPDYKFGFGKINALAAVRTLEEVRYQVNTVIQGETKTVDVTVPAGAVRLRAMITWNDPAAASNASIALVNNLNLSVVNGASTTLPWILNGASPATTATRGVDNINNIEQVTIDNPAAGTYTLTVNGAAIAVGSSQQYTITWVVDMPSIEVTYPNGGESFDPADQETISWTNAGVTGNQTVEYSVDNGATWTVISSTVPAATTRLPWTVAGVNTSQAKIRVSSGALSDESDNVFHILGTPKSLVKEETSCIAGSVKLKWNPVASATHYDVLQLNAATAQWEVALPNI
ncbi:MAG TPA: S8 family serine peptidase, partial [Flavisolibacter sp.]